MEENNNVKKIVIKKDYELTDVVSDILNTPEKKIILTFAEESDLLISSINLQVILETADENDKLLIAQIIKNPSGKRNAKLAGIHIIDTPNTPPDNTWEKVEKEKETRLHPPKPKKEAETKDQNVTEEKQDLHTSSSFEKRINEALEKSKDRKVEQKKPTQDTFISFDEDLPTNREKAPTKQDSTPEKKDLSKVDFKNAPKVEPPSIQTLKKERKEKKPIFDIDKFKDLLKKKNPKTKQPTSQPETRVQKKGVTNPTLRTIQRLAPKVVLPFILLLGLTLFAYYKVSAFVKIKIYVEAKQVSIEETFTGDANIKEIDFDEKKIPIKNESVEKSRSTNITATGVAYRGEKATGSVLIVFTKGGSCEPDETITIPAGTSLTSDTGYSYITNAQTIVNCNDKADAAVTAIEVGEEYNISSGGYFTFQGYSNDQVYGLNSDGAFTGGSKEQYTVLSQSDVDSAKDELKETAIEEGEQELREKYTNWVIIEDSVESDIVKDSVKTDVSVGTEASNVNISLKTESSATYYLKDGFDDGLTQLLTSKAEEDNLFESDGELPLELGDDIQKEITVVEGSGDAVKVKLTASGSVKPDVNKEDITNALKDKNWEEGNTYLKELNYSEKEPVVTFNPTSIPEKLWYFPDKQGGVMIEIKEVTE